MRYWTACPISASTPTRDRLSSAESRSADRSPFRSAGAETPPESAALAANRRRAGPGHELGGVRREKVARGHRGIRSGLHLRDVVRVVGVPAHLHRAERNRVTDEGATRT